MSAFSSARHNVFGFSLVGSTEGAKKNYRPGVQYIIRSLDQRFEVVDLKAMAMGHYTIVFPFSSCDGNDGTWGYRA